MRFFDNVSGTQKLILIAFLVIVALLVFLPDVGERVWQLVRESSAWFLDALNTGE
jgi:hypothetical protein